MQSRDDYQNCAALYDLLFSRALRAIRTNICTFTRHCRAQNIIDLCCGTGEQLRMLSCDNVRLTGVDISPAMLARARRQGPESIHYLEADASRLPFPDASYDAIIISFALHEKTARQHTAIFQEACRLLRADGHIIIADYSQTPYGLSPLLLGKIIIPAIERLAGMNHYHNYRDWMKNGALKGFLERENPGKTILIAPHFFGCTRLCAASQVKENPLQASLNTIQNHSQTIKQSPFTLPLNKAKAAQTRGQRTPDP
ncbi:MAG: class I SAM-dependent methyltransferase [Proteobacteria bacterium]|nr:class I SAM-dependent methyltransferase [Pseudomonadota bacterium]MBU1058382.1 class I SAM-dependent methyltransferase [Pseudomonadota bacterium]